MSENSRDRIITLVRKYGTHSLAYGVFQNNLEYWINNDLDALAAYKNVSGKSVILGDTICPPEEYDKVLNRIVCDLKGPIFLQCSKTIAEILARSNKYKIACLGIETYLDLDTWTWGGKYRHSLRRNRNWAKKNNFTAIATWELSENEILECTTLQNEWMNTKVNRNELDFLLPKKSLFEKDNRVLKILVRNSENQLVGYIYLTPMYKENFPIGYNTTIVRQTKKPMRGILVCAIEKAFEELKKIGVQHICLGLSPFYMDNISLDLRENWTLKKIFRLIYKYGENLYRFSGQAKHKADWRGREEPVFFATNGPIGLIDIWRSFKACDII